MSSTQVIVDQHIPDWVSQLCISTTKETTGSQDWTLLKMGQITAWVIFVVGVLLANVSIKASGDEPTGEEVRLLCHELDDEKYSQNKTLFKLRALPVESWWSKEEVSNFWSVGLFSSSFTASDEQVVELLTPQ